jgi:hypothetical protein
VLSFPAGAVRGAASQKLYITGMRSSSAADAPFSRMSVGPTRGEGLWIGLHGVGMGAVPA